jgi:hypothetical protein
VLLSKALGTMVMTEAEVAGAVNGDEEVPLEAEIVQGFHAQEPIGVLVKQLGESGAADVADKMIEGFCHRQGVLLGARQEIEVVEDGQFEIPQVTIGGTTAAQAQAEQEQPPPAEEAAVILDHGLEAGVGQLVEPAGQFREEVADGFEEGPGQGYDLARLCRLALTWVWIRARDSWVSSRTSCLRRRCS